MLDPVTGRTRVRLVDTWSCSYEIARRYMVRLSEADVGNDEAVMRYTSSVAMTRAAFRERFGDVSRLKR